MYFHYNLQMFHIYISKNIYETSGDYNESTYVSTTMF